MYTVHCRARLQPGMAREALLYCSEILKVVQEPEAYQPGCRSPGVELSASQEEQHCFTVHIREGTRGLPARVLQP